MSDAASRTARVQLPINLAWAKGAYTVTLHLGREARPARLALDTGSSTLVVLPHAYDPAQDARHSPTAWAQEVRYGAGAWAGPVVRTDVHFDGAHGRLTLADVQLSVAAANATDLHDADGLFGLAYAPLDTAHDFTGYFGERGIAPALTSPWPFARESADVAAFGALLRAQPRVRLTPLFGALADAHAVANRFALLVRRALVHVLDDGAGDEAIAADPLNQGLLILGGDTHDVHADDLHRDDVREVQVVHDLYYNVELVALQVGDGPRIAAPPLDARDVARGGSNAFVDTGCSFLVLEASLHRAVLAAFAAGDPGMPALVERSAQAFAQDRQGVPNAEVDAFDWPALHFFLRAPGGGETRLTCPPAHYWQRNALRAGQACCLLMAQLPHFPKQSLLGLPLLAGHYVVFDRAAANGGVLRVATAHPPA
ncbi:MAG TPA: pepsin-like aspartic protease [Xanthomonadaceae bacterium]|nr:pepsin-like aspartic protease [Xanthomonadaceae bacterium]